MPYIIEYSPAAEDHLRALTARQCVTVLDQVDVQLQYEPTVRTRNRKPMRPNLVAPWELRIGNLRVYYSVAEKPQRIVHIRAVGIKRRNQIWIGGRKVDL